MSSSPLPPDPIDNRPAAPATEPGEGEPPESGGRTEFWNGTRWMFWNGTQWISAAEAAMESLVDLRDVGECVATRNAGGGAIGSSAEYSIVWRVWRVGDQWLLDQQDDGMGYELYESEAECMAELRRRLKALQDEDGEPFGPA